MDEEPFPPGLYLISTPIGNLGDISQRALDCLAAVDRIACEDTRHSGRLLSHFGIRKPLVSLHAHNEASRAAQVLEWIREGESIAYVSDAGTPGISDPGERLVHQAIEHGIAYDILPGPSAVLLAAVGAGLGSSPFYFGGFLPTKKGQRQKELRCALERDCTSVYFESPYRIVDSLRMIMEAEPERLICVARELTKRFQEYRRDRASVLLEHYEARPPKGEICLVISGSTLPRWLKPVDSKTQEPEL